MTDQNQSTAVAVSKPPREVRVVESVQPLFSTDRFEHFQRAATALMHSTLLPESIRGNDPKACFSNLMLVFDLSDRWNIPALSIAQCISIVHNKVVYEGKLIDAMLEASLGVKLQYYYVGDRGAPGYRVYVWDKSFNPADGQITAEQLAALAPGKYPDGMRMVDGSVADWQTFDKNGKPNKAWQGTASRNQLAYRGAREWTRHYESGQLLGIYAADEIEEYEERRDQRAAEAAYAQAAPVELISTSFSAPAKTEEPEQTRQAEGESAAQLMNDPEEPNEKPGQLVDAVVGAADTLEKVADAIDAVVDAIEAEINDAGEKKAETVAQDGENVAAETAVVAGEHSAEAQAAYDAQVEEHKPDAEKPDQDDDVVAVGYPEEDEVYFLTGDTWGSSGRRDTYKNGKPFSSTTRNNKTIKVYEDHKPEGPGGAEMAAAPELDAGAADDLTVPVDAFDLYTVGMRNVETFEAAKASLNALTKSEAWAEAMKGVDPQRVRQARMTLALRGEELSAKGKPWIDVLDDLVAFRCWIEIQSDPDAIIGTFQALVPLPHYASIAQDRRDSFEKAVKARVAHLQAGGE